MYVQGFFFGRGGGWGAQTGQGEPEARLITLELIPGNVFEINK